MRLVELEKVLQARDAEEQSFRRANASFPLNNDTTRLLVVACEKLAAEKEAMQRTNYEEHNSDIAFMCRHLQTSLAQGQSERSHAEKLQEVMASLGQKPRRKDSGWQQMLLAVCSFEFPPNQSWWLETSKRLVPTHLVLRAGKMNGTQAEDIMPGDIVFLDEGQRVPTDGRILVFTNGTALDMTDIAVDLGEHRECSTEATDPAVTASANIVLKDSCVVRGCLLYLAVRPAAKPIIPRAPTFDEQEPGFLLDQQLPPGMSSAQCRALFKTLCVKSKFVVRAFRTFPMLAAAQATVLLMTQEILDKAALSHLCAVHKRLGRALLLVDCDCGAGRMAKLSQDFELELVELGDSGTVSTTTSSACQSSSPICRTGTPVLSDLCTSTNLVPEVVGRRLDALAESIAQRGCYGAVLTGVSQASLTRLCNLLQKHLSSPILYATAGLRLSGSLRRIFSPTPVSKASPRTTAIVMRSSMSSASAMQFRHTVSAADTLTSSSATAVVQDSRGASLRPAPHFDPGVLGEAGEDEVSASRGQGKLLLLSLNSVGVVSEKADCVLLRSDVSSLAAALETICKAVPSRTSQE